MIHNIIANKLKNKMALLDEHSHEVLIKSSQTILVKGGAMLAGMLVSVLLGRTIGPAGLGIINLANQIVGLLLVFVVMGLDQVLIKEIAIGYEKNDQQTIANVIFSSRHIMVPVALVLSLTVLIFTNKIVDIFNEPLLKMPLIIAILMMNIQIHSRIFAAGINGFRKIWQSNLVNDTLSTLFVLLALTVTFIFKTKVTVIHVAVFYAIGRLIVVLSMGIYWKSLFKFKGQPKWVGKSMLKTGLPLLLFSASYMIASKADTLMLGWLSTADEVGLYNVAFRLGSLINVFLIISISVLMPKIASMYDTNKIKELERMVQNVTKLLTFIGLFSLLFFVILGKTILSVWGVAFVISYIPLIIVASGQLINVASGSNGVILMMTGYEKILGYLTLISAISNITLNYIFIPLYGATGAALASAVTVSAENITKVIIVKKKTGISTIPLHFK